MTKWCNCQGSILTTEQEKQNLPCERCQKEHAKTFKSRVEELQEEEI